MTPRFSLGFFAVALASASVVGALSEEPVGILLQTPFEGSYGGSFGAALAIAEGRVLIGAPSANPEEAGAAALYDGRTGEMLTTFANPDPADGEIYGQTVALNGSHAVIGNYADGLTTIDRVVGTAYSYDLAAGGAPAQIAVPPELEGRFGVAIAMSETQVLIGASGAGEAGRAGLFDLASGALVRIFEAPDPGTVRGFGSGAALSDRYAVIASSDDMQRGAVHVFDAASGDLLRTIQDATPEPFSGFGRAFALEGEMLLIGVTGDADYPGGAALLYEMGEAAPVAVFTHPETGAEVNFGISVAMAEGRMAVAAADYGTIELGKPRPPQKAEVFVFDMAGAMIDRHGFENQSHFGGGYDISVALGEDVLAVAIEGSDVSGAGTGAGFLFDVPAGEAGGD
ncbi:hypothetical protein AADZ90_016750 [Aestuariibius sp. 2305UL40-4]|uniref:hypothetical protein n=1 Tax=Aestuariibius violaceus TaxID=3234132 RepID=UPI00345EDBC9